MIKKVKVSVIVRTHNEQDWISRCLHEILNQKFNSYEVLLIDNNSSDKTIHIVKKNFSKVKIYKFNPKKYFPGDALNFGISKARGQYVAMISGHCIPKHNQWLNQLYRNFKSKKIAGVYGKQEPLDTSDPNDIRDLKYIFGEDKKIQIKDPFFHNANSMIDKKLWKKNKFDSKTPHIEDRIWAKKLLERGYKIIYEPKAQVFHHHGLNYRGNSSRINKISQILIKKNNQNKINNLISIIPIIKPLKIKDNFILLDLLKELQEVKKIKKIFVICNDNSLKKKCKFKNILFLKRDTSLTKDYLGTDYILKDIYKKKIKPYYKSSHILVAEEPYILKPKNFFQKLIDSFDKNYDAVTPICKSRQHNIWQKNKSGEIEILFKSSLPSNVLNHRIFQELKGMGYLVRADVFEESVRDGMNTKFFEIDNEYSFKLTNKVSNFLK